jgi:hypothetical protein
VKRSAVKLFNDFVMDIERLAGVVIEEMSGGFEVGSFTWTLSQ